MTNIIFFFGHYCYKSKKLDDQEEIILKKNIKIERTRRDGKNVNEDEENFNEEITSQNDKYDDSIDLDGVD